MVKDEMDGRADMARRDEEPACGKRAGFPHIVRSLGRFARGHAVLCVSAVLALATMAAVPPDAAYLGYFDLKVLACLLSILALVAALRNVGVFESISRRIVAHTADSRRAVLALVGATLVLSMVVTNDMALIMMLPLAAATLAKAGWTRLLPFTFVMQNMAANLGGMIVPFGNPQNLYLFEAFSIPLSDFLATMAAPFIASVLLIFACCLALVHPTRADEAALAAHKAAQRAEFDRRAAGESRRSKRGGEGASGLKPAVQRRRLAGGLLMRSGERRARGFFYVALLILVVLAVFRLVPYPMALVAVFGSLAILDRSALRAVDYSLVLTFACFFVFSGNMARIPAVADVLGMLLGQSVLFTGAGVSQVVSNVPAAILLSHMTGDWNSLLVGVNVGGAGTPVASLATLITIEHYRASRAKTADRGLPSLGRFVLASTAWGFGFLAALLAICTICGL